MNSSRSGWDYTKWKRVGDVVVASTALTLLSPVLLVTAVAVKLESEGPALFKQQRLGLHGEAFTMLKFRSMKIGAEAGGVYESRNDTRVTRVGRVIRRTSIDELPQLINIIKGEMSIIGPRPTLTYHPWPFEEYSERQRERFDVRPGVTGWAQINGRKNLAWPERLELDVHYVENMAFKLDCKIVFKTIKKVVMMSDNHNARISVQDEQLTDR